MWGGNVRATEIFRNFSGQNNSASLDSLLSTELITAQNLIFDVRGGYSKGFGRVRYNAVPFDSSPIKTLMVLFKKDGTIKKFYGSGTTLRRDNGDGTHTAIKSDFANTEFDYFSWNDDKLYFLNGVDYYRTDGTTVESVPPKSGADLTGVKRCNMHEWYPAWFRHFFAGDTQDRSALYYSEDSDPTNILSGTTSTAKKVFPTSNLGPITGLKVWRNNVLVGYTRGWFRWAGGGTNPVITADWHQVKASSGPVSNRAISTVRQVLCYAADDGVYLLESVDTSSEDNSRKISKDIDVLYKTLTKTNVSSIFDGRWLYISFPANGTVIVGDFDIIDEEGQPAWSVFTECYANDFLLDNGVVYFAHAQNGLVMKFDEGNVNNDGQPLNFKAQHYVALPDRNGRVNPFALHKIKNILFAIKQYVAETSMKVTVKADYVPLLVDLKEVNESFSWGSEWGKIWGEVNYVTLGGIINKNAKRILVTIENNTLNESCTVLSWALEYKPGKTKLKNKTKGVRV